jgi:glutamate synthase domain-containing protein 3
LRAKFAGTPEDVINYFFFVAEEVRQIMAQLGFRTMDEMIGQADRLDLDKALRYWKARGIDLSNILVKAEGEPGVAIRCVEKQDHGLDGALDYHLIDRCKATLEEGKPVQFTLPIRNANRTCGTMLSGEVAKHYGAKGLPDSTIQIRFHGSAGQSFGAFLAPGLTLTLEGDANDYLGKGMSGGRIIVNPPVGVTFNVSENVIAGNTLLYGATGGEAFLSGTVGERFAVRNSGAKAVVEGLGDHGCEYMTGGVVIVLGRTGRNFAAGMSGGVAYVYDVDGRFAERINREANLLLEPVELSEDINTLRALIDAHEFYTKSKRARTILDGWADALPRFVKVVSKEYQTLLAKRAAEAAVHTNGNGNGTNGTNAPVRLPVVVG